MDPLLFAGAGRGRKVYSGVAQTPGLATAGIAVSFFCIGFYATVSMLQSLMTLPKSFYFSSP